MPSRYSIYIVLAGLGILVLAVAGYSRIQRSSLSGTWLLESNGQRMPDEMRIQIIDGNFKAISLLPYPLPSGDDMQIDTLQLDGKEHVFSGRSGVFGLDSTWLQTSTYSAHLNGDLLSISERSSVTGSPEYSQIEQWSLRNAGRQLVIARAGGKIVYDRAPLTRYLFTNRPWCFSRFIASRVFVLLSLTPMSELTFSQPERRNFLVPLLIAFVVIGGIFSYVYLRPHRIADITITHTAVLPTHTVFKSLSRVVGHEDQAQDDLYVLATVHIDNRLKIPLTIDDITGALTPTDDSVEPATASAIGKNDLDNMYVTFPALKPLSGPPLTRETTIPPGDHAEGMVMLHFPVAETDWNNRKSYSVTITFYHQDPLTVTIPKDQGTGNSK